MNWTTKTGQLKQVQQHQHQKLTLQPHTNDPMRVVTDQIRLSVPNRQLLGLNYLGAKVLGGQPPAREASEEVVHRGVAPEGGGEPVAGRTSVENEGKVREVNQRRRSNVAAPYEEKEEEGCEEPDHLEEGEEDGHR